MSQYFLLPVRGHECSILIFQRKPHTLGAVKVTFYFPLDCGGIEITVASGVILNEGVAGWIRAEHAGREAEDMGHFVDAYENNFLESFLIILQESIIEADHAPDGPLVGL